MRAKGASDLSEGTGPLTANQPVFGCYFPLGHTLHWGSCLWPKITLGKRLNYELLADVVGKIIAPMDVYIQFLEFGENAMFYDEGVLKLCLWLKWGRLSWTIQVTPMWSPGPQRKKRERRVSGCDGKVSASKMEWVHELRNAWDFQTLAKTKAQSRTAPT